MNRTEYLESDGVQAFIDWMTPHLQDGSRLGHHYRLPQAQSVQFTNLADAMRKYRWKIAAAMREPGATGTLADHTRILNGLQRALKKAVEVRSDQLVYEASTNVMVWGGVTAKNVTWLKTNIEGLADLLKSVSDLLGEEDENIERFPTSLRFNAGMTKVYSLLVDEFIIYDSRVAAALCWFVMQWALEKKLSAIPGALQFHCMPPKEDAKTKHRKVRNPSAGSLQFPQLYNDPRTHAQWNLRASWLLRAVLERVGSGTAFHASEHPLRSLEAALFMWGYDLSRNPPAVAPAAIAA
jgi:hypothetical protein